MYFVFLKYGIVYFVSEILNEWSTLYLYLKYFYRSTLYLKYFLKVFYTALLMINFHIRLIDMYSVTEYISISLIWKSPYSILF